MSRGRKPKLQNMGMDWQQTYVKNVGAYLQIIITELGTKPLYQSANAFDLIQRIRLEKERLIHEKKLRKDKTSTLITSQEVPFGIPNQWAWCSLGEIGISRTGTTPSTINKEFFGTDIPFIKPSDITLEGLVYDNEGLSFKGLNEGVKIPKDSILMVCIGGSIGKSFYNDRDVSCNQQINTITPLCGISTEYIQTFLQSPYFQKAIWSKASGGTMPIVNRSKWESIIIPLPPISEQEKIVNFLRDFKDNNLNPLGSYFDEAVEQKIINIHESQLTCSAITSELTHQKVTVNLLRKAFLSEAMQGKLTKHQSSDDHVKELLREIRAVIPSKKAKPYVPIKDQECPFELPDNWEWCRLGEVCKKIGSGSTPNGSNYATSGIPFFRSQNIHNDKLIYEDIKYISQEVHNRMKGTVVYADDILLNITGGSLGRCAIVPKDFFEGNVSQHVCIIRPVIVRNKFLHYLILAPFFQKYIFSSTTGAGREGLPKYNLEQFVIPLPPLAEQQRIIDKLDELLTYCDYLEQVIAESQSQTDMLLQQVLKEALSGKVLVKDISAALHPPQRAALDFKLTDEELRDLLGGYILTKADLQKDFGHLKLIKHMVTVEYAAETPMPTHYIQFPNGPYDKQFMEGIGYRLEKKQWFKEIKKGSVYTYKPLAKVGEIEELFNHFFADKKEQIEFLIGLMNKAKPKQAEIIATVYAVWNDLLINQMDASIGKIKLYFFKWSEKKKAFTPEQVEGCYKWMNEVGLVPKGTGRIIMRFA